MTLTALLGIAPSERVAVIGSGGKTSLIDRLATENADMGVIIAPSTRIALSELLSLAGVDYLGNAEGEKLISAGDGALLEAANSGRLLLMEADGSAKKPLKGWAAHEPVVPHFTTLTVGVIPSHLVGLTVSAQNVHRPELFCGLTGLSMGDTVTLDAVKAMVNAMMGYARGRRALLINQTCCLESALSIARALNLADTAVIIGSCHTGIFFRWSDGK